MSEFKGKDDEKKKTYELCNRKHIHNNSQKKKLYIKNKNSKASEMPYTINLRRKS